MLSTEYRESIERRFYAFCKAVLHNEACNYYRERKHRTQREISFEYLQETTSIAPHSVDEYFVLQDKSTAFAVNGQTVIIDSEKLAKALLCLSERRREIILMRYYLQLRDKQIGALLGKPRTTVNYQKNAALKQLRTEMEKMNDEMNAIYEKYGASPAGGCLPLIIQMPIRFFLLIMRGTPLILQLYGFYFGLYYVAGLSLDRMTAAVISFSLNYAAYFAEIYRSGIQAIPKGQYEAAKVLGFNRSQTFFKIILPQVVKIITPSLGSECMTLVKDTSLAHVIGVMEIYVVATNQMSRSRGMIYLVVAGIFYLIMNAIVSKVFSVIEKRMNYYR